MKLRTPARAPEHPTRQLRTGPPSPLADELTRPQLVRRLALRWTTPVTVVVAGPGFGKSTAMAQAMRANLLAPAGIDGWVGCEAGDEQAEHLATAMLAALGDTPRREDPLADVLDALRHRSPLDVCLIVDDVHEIPVSSSSARLLGDLVRRLPANAHLLLAGREPPAIPLAHLRAGDRLVEVTQDELAFTATERQHLATRLGRDASAADRFGGWPALVRLALSVRDDVAVGFACEEVVAGLDGEDRRALFALATVGGADDALVACVTGAPVDLSVLAARVPLVDRLGDGHFRAHDLWLEALLHVLDPAEVRELEVRAVGELVRRGEHARAGALAIAHADWEALARVGLELVRTTISVLPLDTASSWLDQVPPSEARAPELALLAAAVRAARDYTDASVDGLIDEAADAFRARSDPDSEVVAVALGTVAAQSRCDMGRLLSIAGRALSIPGGEGHPVVRLAARSIDAVVAEMRGDPEIALQAFDEAPLDDVPTSLALAANRFRMHCLLLAGRADEAVAVADESLAVGGMGNRHAQLMPAVARWQAGDPSGYLGSDRNEAVDEHGEAAAMTAGASSRDTFVAAALRAVILASIGQLDRQALRLDGTVGFDNPRDAALITNARAAGAVVDGDEAAAARSFEDFLARHPVGDAVGDAGRLGERHLRRFVALGYVLNRELRARWDTVPLGPAHARARDVARALLAVRAGRRPHAVVPAVVLTVLPLPWSVELACRLHGLGSVDGVALAGWLVDHVGRAVREELRRTSVSTDAALARGATALLSCLPIEPAARLEISVLGPLELRADGQRVTRAELRRARVRELLSVLVVERSVTRERAMDVLWPDFDADVAARNLRVTLTHLRRLLEPERPPGEAGFHLRVDSTTIQLFASPKLLVDLWEMTALRASAAAARTSGDIDRAIELYDAASSLLRGAPLVDVGRLAGFDDEIERARLSQVSALLSAGELRFAQGAARHAASDAERALAVDPYLERAHRLAIAAHLHGHQPGRAVAAVARAQNALDELGVDPEPATVMLMRQAAAWPPAGQGVARAS